MKVQKSVFTVTVLHTEGDAPTGHTSAEEIASRINEDWIGSVSHTTTVDVPVDEVRDELLAMGNDGEFFDYLEG